MNQSGLHELRSATLVMISPRRDESSSAAETTLPTQWRDVYKQYASPPRRPARLQAAAPESRSRLGAAAVLMKLLSRSYMVPAVAIARVGRTSRHRLGAVFTQSWSRALMALAAASFQIKLASRLLPGVILKGSTPDC
jgi:hypothetical protein